MLDSMLLELFDARGCSQVTTDPFSCFLDLQIIVKLFTKSDNELLR